MYGESRIAADVTLTAPTTFATNQATGAQGNGLKFSVEEDEMIVDLEFQGALEHSVTETEFDATFFVDGVDVADLVDGITRGTSNVTPANSVPFYMKKRMRLAAGEHKLEVRFKTAAGNLIIKGLLHPAKLSVTRWSHNATLPAHVASKSVGGIF